MDHHTAAERALGALVAHDEAVAAEGDHRLLAGELRDRALFRR